MRKSILHKLIKATIRFTGFRLRSGPLTGLVFTGEAFCSSAAPKLLGTYEKELHATLFDILAYGVSRIGIIGAAEGYYSVGLAKALPHSQVVSYESDPQALILSRQLARRNQVESRIDFRARCDPGEFSRFVEEFQPEFVLLDVEGEELALLQGVKPSHLKNTHLLIEAHDFGSTEITAPIEKQFAASHTITRIPAAPRAISDIPTRPHRILVSMLQGITGSNYLHERPNGMEWLDLRPRSNRHTEKQST